MKPLSTDDIRQAYLDFFAKKHGHAVIPGASLIPEEDPTVLFTTAGMHPLVCYLLGEKHPAGKRLVNCQRCVRTQDIDEVGDESHLTFFEMLGNWSLGDYFKEGAITMSYEFLTEVLELPPSKLAVSCFGGDKRFPDLPKDEESAEIWKKVGIAEERIAFIEGGVAESAHNWWGPAGRTGPCGPDTEMFYWIGEGEPRGNPGSEPDSWLEIWNDVLMEFHKVVERPSTLQHAQGRPEDPRRATGSGWARFEPLAQQNVDTGMGLERTAQVMQGVNSVYETDRMKPILERVLSRSQMPDLRSQQRHARIIVDHMRAATFIIADGVTPSNVDRGYVLRRLIRRAIRSARQLGMGDQAFTPQIATVVVEQYGHWYPYLRDRAEGMQVALTGEEEKFSLSLKEGLKQFERAKERASGSMLDGVTVFHLYDTYGFPLELTKEIAEERGLSVDEEGFRRAFAEHQKLSRAGAEKRFAGGLADHSAETTKLHTATHLLGASLRKVLGDHVYQKGSNVTAQRLRFDCSHPSKMTPEEIRKVEDLVNQAIRADLPVSYRLMTVEEAKKAGAIGVFEEKYAERVKVYRIGPCHPEQPSTILRQAQGDVLGVSKGEPFSLEICGGPHVAHTGLLGSFRIVKEESVSAGVRRIKAVVSGGPTGIEVAQEMKEGARK